MQKYSKEQLTSMSREELLRTAAQFGITTAGLDDMALVYEILDSSALATAASTAAEATPAKSPRKRTRIKVADTETGTAEAQQVKPAKESTDTTADKPAKRRGRPPKNATPDPQQPNLFAPVTRDDSEQKPQAGNAPQQSDPEFVVVEMTDVAAAPLQATLHAKASDDQPSLTADNSIEPRQAVQQDKTADGHKEPTDKQKRQATEHEPDFIILEDIPQVGNFTQPIPERERAQFTPRQVQGGMAPVFQSRTGEGTRQGKQQSFDFTGLLSASGLLEVVDNYGFLRSADYNYLPSPDDIYVTPQQIRQYALKTGDVVEGDVQPPKDNEKYFTLGAITHINGCDPAVIRDRVTFEFLTPIFPQDKFQLCADDKRDSISSRVVDLFTPIGKGQRALIVAQPKTGKTLLMKDIANSIAKHHPEAYLIMLLIDERPEEVTDMARTVSAEVVASTFDAPADNHVRIAGLVLEKAKRMVECGHDVVIFLDSITRLARAYNTVSPASGKILSGGVDANALQKPKRFFGAARNIENGGSLTIIATALIDTGSKMDEVIFEEFKGTGNMELQLDRTLANKRIFPAVNLVASSTRRDELLQDEITRNRMWIVRKHIADMTSLEAMDLIKGLMEKTINNQELLISINS